MPSTFLISDGLADLVMLIKKGIYTDEVAAWCSAVLVLPYYLTDTEALTVRTYIERTKEESTR